jgi:gliding motility-associated-like protein
MGYATKLASGPQTITIVDDNGCQTAGTVSVPLDTNLTMTMDAAATICEGTATPLNVTSNATSFSWSPATGLSSATIEQPLANPSTTTTYTLTARLGVCTQTGSTVITVLPAPAADAGKPVSTCYGESVQLQGSGGVNYQWSPSTYLNSTTIANPTMRNPVSSVVYSLTVIDANGCTSLKPATVAVTVKAPYRVDAGNDTSILLGQPVQLRAVDVDNVGFNQFSWSPETGLDNPGISNPVATLPQTGVYTYVVTATAADGCSGSDTITVKVFSRGDIYVPNAFTPNHDGHNDVLRAIPVGVKDFRGFSVFDRWGNRVFETTNAAIGWDGTVNGRELPMGTYVWMAAGVDLSGQLVERKGTVILVR